MTSISPGPETRCQLLPRLVDKVLHNPGLKSLNTVSLFNTSGWCSRVFCEECSAEWWGGLGDDVLAGVQLVRFWGFAKP